MGGFNARTGLTQRNHDVGVNSSGARLCNLVAQHDLEFLDLPLGVSPFTRIQGNSRSVIDYILVSRTLASNERTQRIAMFDCMGSDHNPVRAIIGVPARRSRLDRRVEERPAYGVLRDGPRRTVDGESPRSAAKNVRNLFARQVDEALSPWKASWDAVVAAPAPPSLAQLETAATELTTILKQVAERTLGTVRPRRGKRTPGGPPD
jgi:hypothetical protein